MRTPIPALLAALVLAGCSHERPLRVDHAWIRLPAVPGRPAAAYFTVHGGLADVRLIAVTANTAIGAEMHASEGGDMKPLASVAIPARADVPFAPGGRHVMLFDLKTAITPPGPVTLTFSFSTGERILVDTPTLPAGAPAPRG